MILVFDTETTGLPAMNLPLHHPVQPHLVQLAMLLAEDDGTERACINVMIRPDGWEIPERAASVHGITTEIATRAGVSEAMALAMWDRLAQRADVLVAHNIGFDSFILAVAQERTKARRPVEGAPVPALFCTLHAATPLVRLPPTPKMVAAGMGNVFKSPKLSECVHHFFGEDLVGAHDALVDVRACARLYFHLKSLVPADAAAQAA